jgi:hypothetical protein
MRFLIALAFVLFGLACDESDEGSPTPDASSDAQVAVDDSGTRLDSGASHPSDAGKTDAGASATDAGPHCVPQGGSCPQGCLPILAFEYDKGEQCVSTDSLLVGCIAPPDITDPRCLVNVESGKIYQVELSFVETYKDMGFGDAWKACSPADEDAVSSTVTPYCDADAGR